MDFFRHTNSGITSILHHQNADIYRLLQTLPVCYNLIQKHATLCWRNYATTLRRTTLTVITNGLSPIHRSTQVYSMMKSGKHIHRDSFRFSSSSVL